MVNENQNIGDVVGEVKTGQGFSPQPWLLKGPFLEDAHECGHEYCDEHPKRMTGFELYADPDGARLWIASIHGEHVDIPREQADANARLFFAAPALYEALKVLLDTETNLGGVSAVVLLDAVDKARAALALVDKPAAKSAQRSISDLVNDGPASESESA